MVSKKKKCNIFKKFEVCMVINQIFIYFFFLVNAKIDESNSFPSQNNSDK